jgi:hypothetical protein
MFDSGAHGRGRDIALRDRGERDRRLHRRWHEAQEQHPGVQVGGQDAGYQRLGGQAEQWEGDERGGEHQQVQSPVAHAVPGLRRGEAAAIQREQQRDDDLRRDGQPVAEGAACGAHRGQRDDRQQGDEETVCGYRPDPAGHDPQLQDSVQDAQAPAQPDAA